MTTAQHIATIVAGYFGFTLEDLKKNDQTRQYALVRHWVSYFLVKYSHAHHFKQEELAEIIGKVKASVIYGERKIKEYISAYPEEYRPIETQINMQILSKAFISVATAEEQINKIADEAVRKITKATQSYVAQALQSMANEMKKQKHNQLNKIVNFN